MYAGRANIKPLLIDGGVGMGQELLGAGGQLMITTEVENYPGFEHGIQGPELMQIMRKQALRFSVDVVEDMVTRVDFSQRPYQSLGRRYAVRSAHDYYRDRRVRQMDRPARRKAGLGRRIGRRGHFRLRHLRRIFL